MPLSHRLPPIVRLVKSNARQQPKSLGLPLAYQTNRLTRLMRNVRSSPSICLAFALGSLILSANALAGWTEQVLHVQGDYQPPAVALNGDYLAVAEGNEYDSTGGVTKKSRVEVFRRDGQKWTSDAEVEFGSSVALSGNTLAVSDAASASIYVRSATGWQKESVLNSETTSSSASMLFGNWLALDGDTLLVSETFVSGEVAPSRVHVFVRQNKKWFRQQILTHPAPSIYGDVTFGSALAIKGDFAFIGMGSTEFTAAESVLVYERRHNRWALRQELKSGYKGDSGFGSALAYDNGRLVVGAPKRGAAGCAHVFDFIQGAWRQTAMLVPSAPGRTIGFGITVAVHGDQVLVGMPTGPTSLFVRQRTEWVQACFVGQTDNQQYDAAQIALDDHCLIVSPANVSGVISLNRTEPALSLFLGKGRQLKPLIGTESALVDLSYQASPLALSWALRNDGKTDLQELSATIELPIKDRVVQVTLPQTTLRAHTALRFSTSLPFSADDHLDSSVTAILRLRSSRAKDDLWVQTLRFKPDTTTNPPVSDGYTLSCDGLYDGTPTVPLVGDTMHFRLEGPIVDPDYFPQSLGSAPMKFEWKRNGKIVATTSEPAWTLRSTTLADAGYYTVTMTNPYGSVQTEPLALGVIEGISGPHYAKKGASVSLKLVSAGPLPPLSWRGTADTSGPNVAGLTTTTLRLSPFDESLAGDYWIDPATTAFTFPRLPAHTINCTSSLFDASTYSFTLAGSVGFPVNGEGLLPFYAMPNALFSARGLPRGLTMDPKTGDISGSPQESGTFEGAVFMTSSFGSGRIGTAEVLVNDWLPAAYGTYQGFVPRDELLTAGLGGSFTATIAPTGIVTGQMQCGKNTYRFTGSGETQGEDNHGTYKAITRSLDGSHEIIIRMTVDGLYWSGQMKVDIHHAEGEADIEFTAGTAIERDPNAAPQPYAGRYAFSLRPPAPQLGTIAGPPGTGTGTLVVSPQGRTTFVATLADGTKVTHSGAIDSNGILRLHLPLYGGNGSAQGSLEFTDLNETPYAYFTLGGELDWVKFKTRSGPYSSGFPLRTLTVEGARVQPPPTR